MKKTVLIIFTLILSIAGRLAAQELSQVTLQGGSTFTNLALLTDREVLIRISDDGRILEWGVEIQSLRSSQVFAPNLQKYVGRVEYYSAADDSILRGKVRTIGSSVITYYPASETELKRGKVRSIGSQFFDYYDQFENKVIRGKIKYVGNLQLTYYSTFDNQVLVGKLKSVGNTSLQYYNSFDDRLIRGKIKSIGPITYTWYTSLETQYGGGLKTGPFRQSIGGVTYIVY